MRHARSNRRGLEQIGRRFEQWRERHGGPGRPIPEELWAQAAEVAAVEGVAVTARALGVNRARLSKRVRRLDAHGGASSRAVEQAGFVEVDASALRPIGQVVLRLYGRDGERVELEVTGTSIDIAAVARALWSRQR